MEEWHTRRFQKPLPHGIWVRIPSPVLYSQETCEKVLKLFHAENYSKKKISKKLSLPRSSVRDIIGRYPQWKNIEKRYGQKLEKYTRGKELLLLLKEGKNQELNKAYAYILASYLGDGCISRVRRTFKLRIFYDCKYPLLKDYCIKTLQILFPNNKVNFLTTASNCFEIFSYSKTWPELLPQHGPGKKHLRKIELKTWQLELVNSFPIEFIKGLFHSDGCYSSNVVNGKDYPRYTFSNRSQDILEFFENYISKLELNWTFANQHNRSVAKRKDVAYLMSCLGTKTNPI